MYGYRAMSQSLSYGLRTTDWVLKGDVISPTNCPTDKPRKRTGGASRFRIGLLTHLVLG